MSLLDLDQPITTIKVQEIEIPVYLLPHGDDNTRAPVFSATFADQIFTRSSVGLVSGAIEEHVKKHGKVLVSIPYTQLHSDGRVTDGRLTSIHATNGDALGRNEANKPVRFSKYSDIVCVPPLTQAQKEEYWRLVKIHEAAQANLATFQSEHRVNPAQAVSEAYSALSGQTKTPLRAL